MTANPNPHKANPRTPSARKPSPFRVVPPAEPVPPSPIQPAASPKTNPPEVTAADVSSPLRHWRWMVLAGGLVLAGFIPTPYQVGGEVELEWPEGDRQQVRAPRRAIVEEFYVTPGEPVQVGDPIVRLSSRELEQEIVAVKVDIDQAEQILAEAIREQVQAEANLIERDALAATTQTRANRLNQREAQAGQGAGTPEIDGLVVDRDRLATQLDQDRLAWQRYQDLYAQGAISREQVEDKEAVYLNTERDLQAKAADIRHAQQRLADSASDESGNAAYQLASANAARQVAETTDRIAVQERAIATHQQHLQALQQEAASLVLVAEQSGTVLDDDLDLMMGQEVTPDSPLLRIAQLDQLTANVMVKEEELNYFDEGAEVTFRPTSAKLTTYDAEVDKILYDVEPDDTQQRRLATVRVVIDNSDQQLLPGSGGYAKIFSQWIPLYQRLGREVLKLVPSRFL